MIAKWGGYDGVLFSWWDDAVAYAYRQAGRTGHRQLVRSRHGMWEVQAR